MNDAVWKHEPVFPFLYLIDQPFNLTDHCALLRKTGKFISRTNQGFVLIAKRPGWSAAASSSRFDSARLKSKIDKTVVGRRW